MFIWGGIRIAKTNVSGAAKLDIICDNAAINAYRNSMPWNGADQVSSFSGRAYKWVFFRT